jgi:protein-disulfide isomerase
MYVGDWVERKVRSLRPVALSSPTKEPSMSSRFPRARVLLLGILFLLLASPLRLVAQAPATQKPAANPQAKSEAVAEVDGVPITTEQVEKALGMNLSKLQEQIYSMKRQALDALVSERLLANEAARRKITVTALLDAEVTSKVGLVTEGEIEKYYEANKPQFKGGLEQSREQIRSGLQNQKIQAQRNTFIQALKSKANVAILLPAPEVQRLDVDIAGAPSKGPANAPVTLVEFSDFHCPFCKQIEDNNTLTQLLSKYGDQLKLVWIDYPIDQLHPQARKAHEAARCAGDQGKFWEYHKALYTGSPKSGDQLKTVAQQVALDMASFDACFSSGKYQAAVQKDVDQGKRLSVTGTPTFFVNGRPLIGAQPLDAFARVIDDEVARASSTGSKSR